VVGARDDLEEEIHGQLPWSRRRGRGSLFSSAFP
jgi:hypothetical protein